MKTYEVLEKALGLIEDEKNWCQGRLDTLTGQRCSGGAILDVVEAGAEEIGWAVSRVADLANSRLNWEGEGAEGLIHFNDTHSHAEVVALFQDAIRQEKAKAGVPIELPTTREEVSA